MKSTASGESHQVDHLTNIWAMIETKQSLPAVIVVASASEMDDTSACARGIANASQNAGKRTGYVYIGPSRPLEEKRTHRYVELVLADYTCRESFDAALDQWRANFEVIVAEIPQLRTCPVGCVAARQADSVVVSVYPGRRVTIADRDLISLFAQLNAPVVGVVRTGLAKHTPTQKGKPVRSLVSRFFPVRQQ